MNAKARTARQICKARRSEVKDHRAGLHTLTSHAILAGVPVADASGVGNAIRAKAKSMGVCGHAALIVRKTAEGVKPVKGAKRFSKANIAALLNGYNPRVAKYVAAKAALITYVTA